MQISTWLTSKRDEKEFCAPQTSGKLPKDQMP